MAVVPGLAGLAQGFMQGLQMRRENQERAADRAFRLRQLQALQDYRDAQIANMERDDDRANRRLAQEREFFEANQQFREARDPTVPHNTIDTNPGSMVGLTYQENVPLSVATQMDERRALQRERERASRPFEPPERFEEYVPEGMTYGEFLSNFGPITSAYSTDQYTAAQRAQMRRAGGGASGDYTPEQIQSLLDLNQQRLDAVDKNAQSELYGALLKERYELEDYAVGKLNMSPNAFGTSEAPQGGNVQGGGAGVSSQYAPERRTNTARFVDLQNKIRMERAKDNPDIGKIIAWEREQENIGENIADTFNTSGLYDLSQPFQNMARLYGTSAKQYFLEPTQLGSMPDPLTGEQKTVYGPSPAVTDLLFAGGGAANQIARNLARLRGARAFGNATMRGSTPRGAAASGGQTAAQQAPTGLPANNQSLLGTGSPIQAGAGRAQKYLPPPRLQGRSIPQGILDRITKFARENNITFEKAAERLGYPLTQ